MCSMFNTSVNNGVIEEVKYIQQEMQMRNSFKQIRHIHYSVIDWNLYLEVHEFHLKKIVVLNNSTM